MDPMGGEFIFWNQTELTRQDAATVFSFIDE
jgi:hypothetical protein